MGSGYMGRVLWVDLTAGAVREERIPEDLYRRYLAGTGLAAALLYRHIPPGADPLGPHNILAFAAGILTGSGSLFTGRWMVAAKSPLTGGWGDANCGGTFAPAIKRCGYDAILFTGVSQRPVYLLADGNGAELRDAADLWGRDTVETEHVLAERHQRPRPVRVACIGPAGEKRSLIAGVVNDGGRLAARSGLGAVMGAKRLKAVALTGARRIAVHDRARIKTLSRTLNDETLAFQPEFLSGSMIAFLGRLARALPTQLETDGLLYKIMLREYGTVSMNQMSVEMGDAPVKNWKGTHRDFDAQRSASVAPDVFTRDVVAKYFCYSCPLGCGELVRAEDRIGLAHRPEYETVLALGGLLLNDDAESIFFLNERLNRAGMDTISAGATVAFALECYENGLLTRADTDGLELTWGNTEAIVALVGKMIRREGIGDLLADGSRAAAARIGEGAGRFAVHAGGQELGMHDGRFDPGFAVHYAAEAAPGRHTNGSQLYYEMFGLWHKVGGLPEPDLIYFKGSKYAPDREKAVASAACSRYMNVINGAGACLFAAFLGAHRLPLFDWINGATGWALSPADYLEIGGRLQTLKQSFNLRHGIRPRDALDAFNPRALGRPPQTEGANAGRSVPIERLVGDYWEQFGWDRATGRPPSGAEREI